MIMRRWVTWISMLMCLLVEPFSGAAQPLPSSAEPTLAETLHLIQVGRIRDALVPLQQLSAAPLHDALSPDWRKRLSFLLGYLHFHAGDYRKAVPYLQDVRESYPELQDYTLWYLGKALFRLDHIQEAHAAFQHLLEAFPGSVHRPEALFAAANANERRGDLARALDLYSVYQREYPDAMRHGEVHLRLGRLLRDRENPTGALQEWRHLWLEHPEDPAAATVPDLERTLPATFVISPLTSERYYQRAERLYRLNLHREALKAFELARAAMPEQPVSSEMLHHIGMAQYYARENNSAIATFQQLVERTPRAPLAPAALLMLARLHLRVEADGRFLDTVLELTGKFPASKQAAEIRYLVGHFHRNRGRVSEAVQSFRQVAQLGNRSEFADDASWYLGWIQYGLEQYAQAALTWDTLLRRFPASALVADTLYWQGRAFERLGRRKDARSCYERLRTSSRQTYYGYLASARLTGRAPWPWEARTLGRIGASVSTAHSVPEPFPNTSSDVHAIRAAELWAMRLFADAGEELQAVRADGAHALRYQGWAAHAFHRAGEHHRTLTILRRYGRAALLQAGDLWVRGQQEMTFPLGALQRLEALSLDGLDPRFIGALVMAESGWNPRAFSHVGARGLMQLMPETGRRLAQDLGIHLISEDQLFDPALNLRLGIAHVRALLQRFDRQLPLAVAGYNAGEQEVTTWWANRGNLDMEEFIANIPFRETRQYVQRIFVYYAAYQRIYHGLPD